MQGTTILIVDDNAEALRLLEMELSSEGYWVIKARNGEEAVRKARECSPDLIVMDVVMPDCNGGQTIKLLKATTATRDIPVIFLTAMLTKAEEKSGHAVTIDGVSYPTIAKPMVVTELLKEMHNHTHSQSWNKES